MGVVSIKSASGSAPEAASGHAGGVVRQLWITPRLEACTVAIGDFQSPSYLLAPHFRTVKMKAPPKERIAECRLRAEPWGAEEARLGALPHWISRSARNIRETGIVKASALAVFTFITSSNFVGCSIGISPGLLPLRILST